MDKLTWIAIVAMIIFFGGIPFVAAVSAGLAHGKNKKEKTLKVIGYIIVIIGLIAMVTLAGMY
jgi:formate-dependent nitrite reductase membrane component NrfD